MKLEEFWDVLDKTIARAGLKCGQKGGCKAVCCDFKAFNHEPHLCLDEFNTIRDYLQENRISLPPGNRDKCRFLTGDQKCMIYPVRPTLCRIFFCKGSDGKKTGTLPDDILALGTAYDREHPGDSLQARPMSGIIDEIWMSDNPDDYF